MTHTVARDSARALMEERGHHALLVTSYANRRYLTGYSAEDDAPDESAGVFLLSNNEATLFASANNTTWAADESPGVDVVAWKRPWETFVRDWITDRGWSAVGFEEGALVVSSHARLLDGARFQLTPVGAAVDALRARKQPHEVDALRRAIAATDDVFHSVSRTIEAGQSEAHVGWHIERLTRETTGGTVAFHPIVASGPHAARPHHGVSDRQLREGEPIVIDMGVAIDGYCGDLTRTIWLGEPTEQLQAVYNAVSNAHAAACSSIAVGTASKVVDQRARDELEKAGFTEFIVHSVGHGLGLRVHESPSVSIYSDETLEPGHVFTIEPGVYLPDWGGVRIEDVAVMTASGYDLMTAAEKHPGWAK